MNKEKFLSIYHSIVPDDNGCLMWPLSVLADGYGAVNIDGKSRRAHRYSYSIFRGPIGPGLCACHHCDVKLCINPAHLFLGTALKNNRDCMKKGRHTPGVKNAQCKLTEKQVLAIREMAKENYHRVVAKKFNISRRHVTQIVSRVRWRHL